MATAIKIQHLGNHPWDALTVGLYKNLGLTIGIWNIIISFMFIIVTLNLDKSYIKIGTFLNAFIVGLFVDYYLGKGILLNPTYSWIDIFLMIISIIIMGIGSGVNNASRLGSGPRDGFMLSLAKRINISIIKVRIITESIILIIAWLIGGSVFVFTFLYTFIHSPIFQVIYYRYTDFLENIKSNINS